MARRPRVLLVLAVLIVAVGAIVAVLAWSADDHAETSGAPYCAALRHPKRAVATARGAISGAPVAPGLELDGLRSTAGLLWTDATIEAAPKSERSRARTLVDGLNRALADESLESLDAPAFTAAVDHLEARSAELCPA